MNRNDRTKTREFAVLDAMMEFATQVRPDIIEQIHHAICKVMTQGSCAWAFQDETERDGSAKGGCDE